MDPITTAIVTALSAGLAGVGKESIRDAYQGLKMLLNRKFGSQSKVVKAVEDLEGNPSSQPRTAVLQEEVAKAGADRDPELLRTANYILQQIHYSSSFRQSGNANVQAQAGQNVFVNSGRGRSTMAGQNIIYGRPWIVALVAIVLVAIFAFLIWQLFPSVRQMIPGLAAAPTPTPSLTATPAQSLTSFCALIQANGSSYAYTELYSDHLKQQVTPQQFEQQWSYATKPVSSCIGNISSSSDNSATGTITVQDFPNNQIEVYSVTLIKDQNGQWKIDSMQKQ